ncbi:hypothetical protein fugu_014388 [Takifugu bimaculatus]|uniref:Cyclin N-terminal domain-containing protein n=1 Tax=Takifugu bimaculatus TaxID=433685 RepID=A0A4Z2C1M9_9TELE|nr:hypothetical protein fugu_014388 [Takifugu bimaculatus]
MGNTASCCVSGSPKLRRNVHTRLDSYQQESDLSREETGCNLQHISDRENVDEMDLEYNPSDHPRATTIFLSKSQNDVREKRKSVFINNEESEEEEELLVCESNSFSCFLSTAWLWPSTTTSRTEICICPGSWRRIVLGSILLASKVWDDQAVWNVDYCQILKDMTVEDMNELERHFLELLQFNINVPSSVYAKYYFDLRSLSESNNLNVPLEPLSRDKAQRLEAISRLCDDKFKDIRRAARKRSGSVDNLCRGRWVPAILS